MALALVLVAQNIAIFRRHYFKGFVFPDDFLLTYHAVPAYWIEVLGRGRDIAWIAVQAIGYPIYMALQSGYGYLPLRAFAWVGAPYTLHAAVVLQGLHVLLGAAGAVVCSRLLGAAWRNALLAGVLYQCFGGFYSNAQHPDIVRSFAFLPWLCAPVLCDWRDRSRLFAACTALLPVWGYAQFTGGYPGAAIASTLLLGGVTVLRLAIQADSRRTGALVLAAQAAGPLLAGWVLVPPALDAAWIDRSQEVGQLQYDYMQVRDLLALAFPVNSNFFAHDVSMRSIFVALPGLVLLAAFARRWRELPRWPLCLVALALLLAMGPLHQVLKAIVPPAGLSRFVMADYRGFVVLGMILLGVHGLGLEGTDARRWRVWPLIAAGILLAGVWLLGLNRAYAREDQIAQVLLLALSVGCCLPGMRVKEDLHVTAATGMGVVALWAYREYLGFVVPAAARSLVLVLALGLVLTVLWIPRATRRLLAPNTLLAGVLVAMALVYQAFVPRPDPNGQVVMLCVLAAATLLCLTELSMLRLTLAGVLVLAALTVADWSRVNRDQRYFAPPIADGQPWIEASVGPLNAARQQLDTRLRARACRPQRLDPADTGPARWAGYYTGEPHLQDHGTKLVPQLAILRVPELRTFAQQPWRMVEVPASGAPVKPEGLSHAVPVLDASCLWADTTTSRYRVRGEGARQLVENEVFWPGWTAELTCLGTCSRGGTVRLEPTSTLGFRTWTVPAGDWQMDLRFRTPHALQGWMATGIGLVLWLLVCALLGPLAFRGVRGRPAD